MSEATTTHPLDDWLSALADRGMSANTIRGYGSDVRQFLEYKETYTPGEDYVAAAASWFRHMRGAAGAATLGRKRSALAKWSLFAREDELNKFLLELKLPPIPKGRAHPVDGGMATVRRMIDASRRPLHKRLIALCGLCGLRVFEACSVTKGHLSTEDGTNWLRVVGKGGHERMIPVSASTMLILDADGFAPDARLVPCSEGAARSAIIRIGKSLGLEVSSHDLRHTYGTAIYEKTKDLRLVQELLGHHSSTTTEIYTGVSEATMIEGVESIEEYETDAAEWQEGDD